MESYIPLPSSANGYVTPQVLSQLGLQQASVPGFGTIYKDSSGNYFSFNGSAFTQNQEAQQAANSSSQTQNNDQGNQQNQNNQNNSSSQTGYNPTGGISRSGGGGTVTGTANGVPFSVTYPPSLSGNSDAINNYVKQQIGYTDSSSQPQEGSAVSSPNINQNLGPGSTGDQVKQLQQWLVSQGYMTQAQMNTGTGTYGPQTTNAVRQWQQANNITTDPSQLGYFGPKSMAFLQGGSTAASNAHAEGDVWQQNGQWMTMNPDGTITSTSGSGGTGSSGTSGTGGTGNTNTSLSPDMVSALQFLGWSQDQINSASPSDAQNWAMIGEYLQKQVTIQGAAAQVNAESLNQAYTAALNDPTIKGKYADMQASDVYGFQQQMQQLQQAATTTGQQQQQQYLQQIQQMQQQLQSGGQEYSGYANQASNQLNQNESGIIQSTQANLQNNLNQLVSQYQLKYGNQGLYGQPTYSSLFGGSQQGITYTNPMAGSYGYDPTTGLWGPMGGQTNLQGQGLSENIQGTNPLAYEQDILSKQQQIYQGLGQTQ